MELPGIDGHLAEFLTHSLLTSTKGRRRTGTAQVLAQRHGIARQSGLIPDFQSSNLICSPANSGFLHVRNRNS